MVKFKFNVIKFALTGGIYLTISFAGITLLALLNIPGFKEFSELLVKFYNSWGYSVSIIGIFAGALLGFIEGFIHFGFVAWLYNKLTK